MPIAASRVLLAEFNLEKLELYFDERERDRPAQEWHIPHGLDLQHP